MLFYIFIFIIICVGIFLFFFIKDLMSIIDYISYQRKIKIYNKKFKKYLEDKKHLLDKRLQHEREIRKQYGLELSQGQEEVEEYIVDFKKPIGEHTKRDLEKNAQKYAKIIKIMNHLSSKGIKNTYWRVITNTAHRIAGVEKDTEILKTQEEFKSQGRSGGRER